MKFGSKTSPKQDFTANWKSLRALTYGKHSMGHIERRISSFVNSILQEFPLNPDPPLVHTKIWSSNFASIWLKLTNPIEKSNRVYCNECLAFAIKKAKNEEQLFDRLVFRIFSDVKAIFNFFFLLISDQPLNHFRQTLAPAILRNIWARFTT